MTLEPPAGLKQNVLSSYDALTEAEFEGCTKPNTYKKLLFAFCFFHAIVQDRRKFGPIGWNIQYAFTNEDLAVSRRQLKIFVEDYEEVPYKVLNKIGSEINYGGRVTDYIDVRLIKTILEGYINSDILKDNHPLSASGIYYSPVAGDKEDYVDYIKSLPLNPSPEAFGLHDNAEISTNQINTATILSDMISMQAQVSASGGKTSEEIIGEQAKYLQEKTPQPFDLEKVSKKFPTSYEESMNTVLFQECVRYNALLKEMHRGLVLVQKALVGE
jgi:dynein heavy chain